MVHFYCLVSCSDPGLRISLSPGLLHHCNEMMNPSLLQMWPYSPDIFNCMRTSPKSHKHLNQKNISWMYARGFWLIQMSKSKKISRLISGNWLCIENTHLHPLALTVECHLWRRSDGLEQTGSYHSMLRVLFLLPRYICSHKSKIQTILLRL